MDLATTIAAWFGALSGMLGLAIAVGATFRVDRLETDLDAEVGRGKERDSGAAETFHVLGGAIDRLNLWTRSKVEALGKDVRGNKASILSLAQRMADRSEIEVKHVAVGEDDDEPTVHLTDADIVMPKRR